MKKLPLLVLSFIYLQSIAQKQDYTWMIYKVGSACYLLDFNSTPPSISIDNKISLLKTSSTYCDKNGILQFYTNGIQINNWLDELVENGDSINYGEMWELYSDVGYLMPHAAFFLDKPQDTTQCYLLHMFVEYLGAGNLPQTKLYYTLIDKSANNGEGKVLVKNVPLLTGDAELNYNHAVAVRHGNGRDWWILVPHRRQSQYFRLLLTPDGFSGPWMQEIGEKEQVPDPTLYFGVSQFSPDGSKYAEYDLHTGTQVFDFDRCSGLLSNPIKIDFEIDPNWNSYFSGLAFSPSGRFLYLTRPKNGHELLQYDLESSNVFASEKIVAQCNTTNSVLCGISNPILAPDGKIYVPARVDTTSYNVIHQPDSLGDACEFEWGGLEFPENYPGGCWVYYPNYRLYDLPGSGCDTLGINAPLLAKFSTDKQSGCVPLTVNFQNTSDYQLDSVQWHFPGGQPAFSNEMNPSVLYEVPGIFDATLIVFADNLSDTLSQSAYIQAIADDCPQAEIFTQINDLSVTVWTNCEEGFSYSWDMGDGTVFNTEGVAYQYDSAGTYNLQLIINGNCGSDTAWTTIVVKDPTSTKDPKEQFHFVVQPNPTNYWLEISTQQLIAQPVVIRLRNTLGETVLQTEKEHWQGRKRLSLSHLPSGSYFYEIEVAETIFQTGKMAIVR